MEGYETASDGRSRQIKALNTHLDNVKFKIKEKYRSLLDKEATITPQIMKNAYLGNQLNKKGIHLRVDGCTIQEWKEKSIAPAQ